MKTDIPFYDINWYINGAYAGWSDGSNVKTEAYFSPNSSDYPGNPFGITYDIQAVVSSLDDNGDSDSATGSYSVTVYTTGDVDEGVGMHTEAYGHASADAGWNGTTAEATSYGSISNNTGKDISFAIVIFYWVIEVDDQGRQLNQFGAANPIKNGTIRKNAPSQSDALPHSDSFEITWFEEGDEFEVQPSVTVTAWDPENVDWEINNVDKWTASDSDSWEIPQNN